MSRTDIVMWRLLSLLAWISASMTEACTWYISPDGDNTNDGRTLETAFATWLFTVNSQYNLQLQTGDVVCVAPGVYEEVMVQADTSIAVQALTSSWPPSVTLQPPPLSSGGNVLTVLTVTVSTTFAIDGVIFQGPPSTPVPLMLLQSSAQTNISNCVFQNTIIAWNGVLVQLNGANTVPWNTVPSIIKHVMFFNISGHGSGFAGGWVFITMTNVSVQQCVGELNWNWGQLNSRNTMDYTNVITDLLIADNVDSYFYFYSASISNLQVRNNQLISSSNLLQLQNSQLVDATIQGTSAQNSWNTMAPPAVYVCSTNLFQNVVFQNNLVTALVIDGSCQYPTPTVATVLANCSFLGNAISARKNAQNGQNGGAAILIDPQGGQSALPITITDCLFRNNSAPYGSGGAIWNTNLAQQLFVTSITGSTFIANTAMTGGALAIPNANIADCEFDGNVATTEGGAIDVMVGGLQSVVLETSLFNCNRGSNGMQSNHISGPYIDRGTNIFHDACGAVLTGIIPTHGTVAGNTSITIFGSEFPPNPDVTIGENPCLNPRLWNNGTAVTCQTVAGVGLRLPIVVSAVGYFPSLSNLTWSYDLPTLTSVQPLHGPTNQVTVLTINGDQFVLGYTTVKVGTWPCDIFQLSTTQLLCQVDEGVGCNLTVVVSVDNQKVSSPPAMNFWFDPPVLQAVWPLLVSPVNPFNLTLVGQNFGTNESVFPAVTNLVINDGVFVDPVVMQDPSHAIWSQPTPFATGSISMQLVFVYPSCVQRSNVVTYTFAPATLTSVSPTRLKAAVATTLTVVGTNFLTLAGRTNMKCKLDNETTAMFVISDTLGTCSSSYHDSGNASFSISNAGDAETGWSSAVTLEFYAGCSPGQYGNLQGDNCKNCSAGTFTNQGGLQQCAACGPGTFAPDMSATTCLQCPEHATTSTLASSSLDQCLCEAGYVWSNATNGCLLCPSGATCAGGRSPAVAAAGFDPSPFSDMNFYPCPNSNCLGNDQCAVGYNGFLCDRCVKDYWQLERTCFPCSRGGAWAWTVVLTFLLIVALALIIYLSLDTTSASNSNLTSPVVTVVPAQTKPQPNDATKTIVRPRFSMIVANLISFYQLWKVVSNTDPNPIPRVTNTAMQNMMFMLNIFQIDFKLASPQCLTNTELTLQDDTMLVYLVPIVVLPLFALGILLVLGIRRALAETSWSSRVAKISFKSVMLASVRLYMMGLVAVYLPILQASVKYLDCVDIIGDSHSWVRSEPSVECGTSSYQQFLPVPILMIILVGCCLPIAIVVALERLSSTMETLRYVLGFLIDGLKPDFRFKFALDMGLKLVSTLVLVLHTTPNVQLVVLCMVYFAYTCFLRKKKPYSRREYNDIDFKLYACLCAFTLIMVMRISNEPKSGASTFVDVVTFMLFIPFFGYAVLLSVYSIWIDREYIKSKCRCCVKKSDVGNLQMDQSLLAAETQTHHPEKYYLT